MLTTATSQVAAQCTEWSAEGPFQIESDQYRSGSVNELVELSNGDIVVAGFFSFVQDGLTHTSVSRWDGTRWSPLWTGVRFGSSSDFPGVVEALLRFQNDDILVGGSFDHIGDIVQPGIGRWNGTSWSPFVLCGDGLEGVQALEIDPNGNVIAAGIQGGPLKSDGDYCWRTMGSGLSTLTRDLITLANGNLVAAGVDILFTDEGVGIDVAQWDGAAWSPLGSTIEGAVLQLAKLSNGDLIATGTFEVSGCASCHNIARWDGTSWTNLGDGLPGPTYSPVVLPNDEIVVSYGGNGRVAKWNGVAWTNLPDTPAGTSRLALLSNGMLVAMGVFQETTGYTCFRFYNGIPIISTQPRSTASCSGSTVSLSVAATGSTSLFQWRKNGVIIPGATNSSLSLISASLSDSGFYDCVVSNDCGTAVSDSAVVDIRLPQMLSQPLSANVGVDQPVAFAVETNPQSPCDSLLSYQWQRRNPLILDDQAPDAWIDLANGGGFVGVHGPSLSILRPTPGLATGYRCKITNACGCEADANGVIYTDTVNYSAACPSDFNLDGSVDGDDVITFFERWDSGC